jgi:hypothetical protein
MEKVLNLILEKLDMLDLKVDKLDQKVDSVILEMKDIKDTMATKHDLEYFDLKIGEHSRQIYKLKNQ